jgi:hypothetical protein
MGDKIRGGCFDLTRSFSKSGESRPARNKTWPPSQARPGSFGLGLRFNWSWKNTRDFLPGANVRDKKTLFKGKRAKLHLMQEQKQNILFCFDEEFNYHRWLLL